MAWEARSGLKPYKTLQWHLGEARWKEAHQGSQKRRWLPQVSAKCGGRLLQGGNGQGLGRGQVPIVGVTADGAMRAPGSPGRAVDLTMNRQTTLFAHETKRRERREVSKPLWGIGLK